jgi:hypothetical protein
MVEPLFYYFMVLGLLNLLGEEGVVYWPTVRPTAL